MRSRTDDAWEEVTQAELATAGGPASADSFCRVARAYEQLGLPEVALAVLRKVGCFGIASEAVLPSLLRGHRKLRQFAELNAAVQTGLAISARAADLRRELALALSNLGQAPAAAAEWAALIRQGGMSQTDWIDCARFVMSGADAGALADMTMAIGERRELKSCALASYCAVKQFVECDRAAAQCILRGIAPSRIPDAEILLDLAILAWRLHDYARAEAAATRAANSDAAPSMAQEVLGIIRSFAGDASLLREVPLPLASPASVLLDQTAPAIQPERTAWGFFDRRIAPGLRAEVLDLAPGTDMAVPEEADPICTFSVLPAGRRHDPFHVLSGVDWSWPHILVQRKPSGDVLHFFVEAQGHRDWMWEEVRLPVGGLKNHQACASGGQPSATWSAAVQELREGAEDEL